MTDSQKLDLILESVGGLNGKVDKLETEMKLIKLSLENETNRNIMRIAEGHLDLSRKLDDALKIDSEKEMLTIRVNILESELKQIKERLVSIA